MGRGVVTAPELDLGLAPKRRKGVGSHQSQRAVTDTWLTPPWILEKLGHFDLDPCAASEPRPWPTAGIHYTREMDGLSRPWIGRVWLNPPYGPATGKWLARLASHDNGVALVFARTETATWFEHIWPKASAILFFRGRLNFHFPNGTRSPTNAGAPSALVAYGADNARCLLDVADVMGWAILGKTKESA